MSALPDSSAGRRLHAADRDSRRQAGASPRWKSISSGLYFGYRVDGDDHWTWLPQSFDCQHPVRRSQRARPAEFHGRLRRHGPARISPAPPARRISILRIRGTRLSATPARRGLTGLNGLAIACAERSEPMVCGAGTQGATRDNVFRYDRLTLGRLILWACLIAAACSPPPRRWFQRAERRPRIPVRSVADHGYAAQRADGRTPRQTDR